MSQGTYRHIIVLLCAPILSYHQLGIKNVHCHASNASQDSSYKLCLLYISSYNDAFPDMDLNIY